MERSQETRFAAAVKSGIWWLVSLIIQFPIRNRGQVFQKKSVRCRSGGWLCPSFRTGHSRGRSSTWARQSRRFDGPLHRATDARSQDRGAGGGHYRQQETCLVKRIWIRGQRACGAVYPRHDHERRVDQQDHRWRSIDAHSSRWKISLDEDINKYLPFKVANPSFPNEPITLRQLATHTSRPMSQVDRNHMLTFGMGRHSRSSFRSQGVLSRHHLLSPKAHKHGF